MLTAAVVVLTPLAAACDATMRHKVLTTFFDGVPPQRAPEGAVNAPASTAMQPRPLRYREHGPYAAKLCNGCHVPGAGNALVAPSGELCLRCHEFRTDKRYIHGPVASGGGCRVCHDPHSSPYDHLLVSDSDAFCYYCHDRAAVAAVSAHAGGEQRCTICHDAHMSNKPHLLK